MSCRAVLIIYLFGGLFGGLFVGLFADDTNRHRSCHGTGVQAAMRERNFNALGVKAFLDLHHDLIFQCQKIILGAPEDKQKVQRRFAEVDEPHIRFGFVKTERVSLGDLG